MVVEVHSRRSNRSSVAPQVSSTLRPSKAAPSMSLRNSFSCDDERPRPPMRLFLLPAASAPPDDGSNAVRDAEAKPNSEKRRRRVLDSIVMVVERFFARGLHLVIMMAL